MNYRAGEFVQFSDVNIELHARRNGKSVFDLENDVKNKIVSINRTMVEASFCLHFLINGKKKGTVSMLNTIFI